MKKASDNDHGIQVANSSIVADKLINIRVTIGNLAIQKLLLNKPLPAEFSRFKFYGTQKDMTKAVMDLVNLANNEVSNLITTPNLYHDSLKSVLVNHQFSTLPSNVVYDKKLNKKSTITCQLQSSSQSTRDEFTASNNILSDSLMLFGVRVGSEFADKKDLNIKSMSKYLMESENVYLEVTADCGKPPGKYRAGMIFFLKKIIPEKSTFWVMGPLPLIHQMQLRFSSFEIEAPELE